MDALVNIGIMILMAGGGLVVAVVTALLLYDVNPLGQQTDYSRD
jgi:hypothetical protein